MYNKLKYEIDLPHLKLKKDTVKLNKTSRNDAADLFDEQLQEELIADYEYIKEKQEEMREQIKIQEKANAKFTKNVVDSNKTLAATNKEKLQEFKGKLDDEEASKIKYLQKVLDDTLKESELTAKQKIDNFEKNLVKLGLNVTEGEFKQKQQNGPISSEMMMQKIRDKIKQNELAKKEKERRQRRMKHNQNKTQEEREQSERESLAGKSVKTKNGE